MVLVVLFGMFTASAANVHIVKGGKQDSKIVEFTTKEMSLIASLYNAGGLECLSNRRYVTTPENLKAVFGFVPSDFKNVDKVYIVWTKQESQMFDLLILAGL